MALSRVKIWTSEVLTASDLNAEFNNILNYVNASPIIAVDALTKATGDILQWTGTAWANKTPAQLAGSLAASYVNYISGLTLSTAGSSATFGVASGSGTDSTNADLLILASAFTKTTSVWAVGTGNGSLDTGSVANNTWYHAYVIKRPDTGLVDVLVSLSATAPTMPTSYTLWRRIGAMKTNGSAQWVSFSQRGDEFLWSLMVSDKSAQANSTTAALAVLSVPTGIQVNALFAGRAVFSASTNALLFTSPDQADTAPSSTLFDLVVTTSPPQMTAQFNRRTDISGRVRVRALQTDGTYDIITFGWSDARGKS